MNEFARFTVIDSKRGVILGKSFLPSLKENMIYEIVEILGEFIIKEVGYNTYTNYFENHKYLDVNTQVNFGTHLLTEEEHLKILENDNS